MNSKQEILLQLAICLLMILLAVGGLAYGVVAGLILAHDAPFSLDGILLTLICLSILVTFGGLLVNLAMQEGWLGRKGKGGDEGASSSAAPPSKS